MIHLMSFFMISNKKLVYSEIRIFNGNDNDDNDNNDDDKSN